MSQTCPYCQFQIPDAAVVCGHCGAEKQTVPNDTLSDGGPIEGIIGAVVCGALAWTNTHSFKFTLLAVVGGFFFGLWMGIITTLGRCLLYGLIGALILGFIFSLFKWTWAGAAIGAVLGFISGFNDEKVVWTRR